MKKSREELEFEIAELRTKLNNANEKFALISTMVIPTNPEKAVNSLSIIIKQAKRWKEFEGFQSMSIKRRFDVKRKALGEESKDDSA